MSQQFYNKYRHLFEDELHDNVKLGYDTQIAIPQQLPQFKLTSQQPNYRVQHSPIKQTSPQRIFQQSSQYIPQQQSQYIPSQNSQYMQNERLVQSRKNYNDDRIRKQVMQDNIFKIQPQEYNKQERSYVQNSPQTKQQQEPQIVERKQHQQTYNVFQDQDILDDYAPKKQRQFQQPVPENILENNIHKVYLQRLNDLEYIRKKYVDPKQLARDIDQNNPYKAALQQRILVQFNGNQRKAKLKELLKS